MRFVRATALGVALLPVLLLALYAAEGAMGANPIDYVFRATGTLTIVFLLATLAVTPLRRVRGFAPLGVARRVLGLAAFAYATAHALQYAIVQKHLRILDILRDGRAHPYVLVGMLAYALLLPLAWTSRAVVRRALGGRQWQRVHRLVYPAAALGVAHVWMLVKADVTRPKLYAVALTLLLAVRAIAWGAGRLRESSPARPAR